MSRRRLLVICHGFPPYYGGAEHVAGYLAREAQRSGPWETGVLTSDLGGRLAREEHVEGLHIFRVPARKKEWTRHTALELGFFYLSACRNAGSIVGRFRPDHVLAHFSFPAGAVARRLWRRFRVPYSVVLHGSDVPGYQPERFGLVYPLMRPLVRRVWAEAEHVVAVSEDLKNLALETWAAGDIKVIPNGVDTERFHPAPLARAPAQEQASPADAAGPRPGAPGDKVKMVVVAQLIERKGLQHLLEALALLDDPLRKKVAVEIYGTGPFAAPLKDQAATAGLAEHVAFRGLASHEDLPGLLRGAEAFVLPSLQEGLPLALLEAMASGLAIVATRVGGMASVLADGRNALLVEPADAQGLAGAITRLVSDPSLRARLRQAARDSALPYGWTGTWRAYSDLLCPSA